MVLFVSFSDQTWRGRCHNLSTFQNIYLPYELEVRIHILLIHLDDTGILWFQIQTNSNTSMLEHTLILLCSKRCYQILHQNMLLFGISSHPVGIPKNDSTNPPLLPWHQAIRFKMAPHCESLPSWVKVAIWKYEIISRTKKFASLLRHFWYDWFNLNHTPFYEKQDRASCTWVWRIPLIISKQTCSYSKHQTNTYRSM